MKKKLKKYLLRDLEESYYCNVTPESIIEKTDFFNKVNIVSYNHRYYRKAVLISSCMTIMLLFVVTILAISNNRLSSTISAWDDLTGFNSSYEPTANDLKYINNNCYKRKNNFNYIISIDKNFDLVVYKGYKSDEHRAINNIYFYKIVLKNELEEVDTHNIDLSIICEGETHVINENNSLGILTIRKISDEILFDDISITIINNKIEKDYVLSILNSL